MFSISETVLYGTNGLCKIVDITKRDSRGSETEYYVLKPISEESTTIFVPLENEELVSKMRKAITADEIRSILRSLPADEDIWIGEGKQRQDKFKEIINTGNLEELILLIRSLYLQQQASNGKKLHLADERILKEAQKLLHQEIALAMDIKPDEVVQFIIDETGQSDTQMA